MSLASHNLDPVDNPTPTDADEVNEVVEELITCGDDENVRQDGLFENGTPPIHDGKDSLDCSNSNTCKTCVSSSDSDSTSSCSDGEDIQPSKPRQELTDQPQNTYREHEKFGPLVKGELTISDLPKIEELKLDVDDKIDLLEAGSIHSVVDCLVIVKANQGVPPLDEDTVLFIESRRILGQIFETFGPVISPFYSIRFNNAADVLELGINTGDKVFYVPSQDTTFTNYIFVSQIKDLKGSDSSWKDNHETPEKMQDFSDDEQERIAKAKLRAKNHKLSSDYVTGSNDHLPKRGGKIRRPPRCHPSQTGPHRQESASSYDHYHNRPQFHNQQFYSQGRMNQMGLQHPQHANHYVVSSPQHQQPNIHPSSQLAGGWSNPAYHNIANSGWNNIWPNNYQNCWTDRDSSYYQPTTTNKPKFVDSRYIQNNTDKS